MMIAKYENGAVHNDHHKELNIQAGIMTSESLAQLINGFMQEEEKPSSADAEIVTLEEEEPSKDNESSSEPSAAEGSAGDGSTPSYPPITQAQERFFDRKYRIKGTYQLDKERKVEHKLPMEQLLHRLYEYTHAHNWAPSEKTSAHRWKMLYEMLHRRGIIQEQQLPRYRDFVRAVVNYCYPESSEKYSNNISKTSSLPNSIHQWPDEDRAELRGIIREVLGEMV